MLGAGLAEEDLRPLAGPRPPRAGRARRGPGRPGPCGRAGASSSPFANAAFVSASICDGIEPEAAVAADRLHQLVEDVGDGEDLLLADAEQVVVERRPLDDRLRGVLEAGRRVDDDRRIARPRHDRPPLARQRRARDRRPARHDQEPHPPVIEQRRGRLERRRVDDRQQVVDPDRLRGSPG